MCTWQVLTHSVGPACGDGALIAPGAYMQSQRTLLHRQTYEGPKGAKRLRSHSFRTTRRCAACTTAAGRRTQDSTCVRAAIMLRCNTAAVCVTMRWHAIKVAAALTLARSAGQSTARHACSQEAPAGAQRRRAAGARPHAAGHQARAHWCSAKGGRRASGS